MLWVIFVYFLFVILTEIPMGFFVLLKNISLFRERGREGERQGEKHLCVREPSVSCLSHMPNLAPGPHPGMCPHRESNWQPFGLQASAQSTEPHPPGWDCLLKLDEIISVWRKQTRVARILLKRKSHNRRYQMNTIPDVNTYDKPTCNDFELLRKDW